LHGAHEKLAQRKKKKKLAPQENYANRERERDGETIVISRSRQNPDNDIQKSCQSSSPSLSIFELPSLSALWAPTTFVFQSNHFDWEVRSPHELRSVQMATKTI